MKHEGGVGPFRTRAIQIMLRDYENSLKFYWYWSLMFDVWSLITNLKTNFVPKKTQHYALDVIQLIKISTSNGASVGIDSYGLFDYSVVMALRLSFV